ETLKLLLELAGNSVRVARDGEEALQAADEFRPHVALLDIGMPKLNGYDAARRIRDEPWGKEIILIAVTGWGRDEERRLARDAGFDKHLLKPVDPQSLMQLVAELHASRLRRRIGSA